MACAAGPLACCLMCRALLLCRVLLRVGACCVLLLTRVGALGCVLRVGLCGPSRFAGPCVSAHASPVRVALQRVLARAGPVRVARWRVLAHGGPCWCLAGPCWPKPVRAVLCLSVSAVRAVPGTSLILYIYVYIYTHYDMAMGH